MKYLVGKLEEDVRGLEEELDGEKGRQWRKHDKAGELSWFIVTIYFIYE